MSFSSSNVERGFSTINRILTTARISLGKKHVDDLMMIRVNVPTLQHLDANYEEKLVKKATDLYLQQKRYKTHSRTTNFRGKDTTSEDLFLPKKRQCIESNILLCDENYLIIDSDSESDSQKRDSTSDDSETEQ